MLRLETPEKILSVFVGLLLTLTLSTSLQAQPIDMLEATGLDIAGYADRMSVQPGETINFLVSTRSDEYEANLVRLIHGDTDPRSPGMKMEDIEAPFSGRYPGRVQTWDSGSYGRVADHDALQLTGSFTMQAWIYPTTPHKGVQGLLTKWAPGGGYGLFINEDGHLSLWLRDNAGRTEKIHTNTVFRAPRMIKGHYQAPNWYFIAVVFDAESNTATLYQQPQRTWLDAPDTYRTEHTVDLTPSSNTADLIIGGYWQTFDQQEPIVEGHFNGKIDGPRIYNRALTPAEVATLRESSPTDEGLVGAWDFSRDVSSDRITDVSGSELHGRVVHMPIRAVTGHNWTGREINYAHAPDQYNAIYFHDDDLEDAGWEADFSYTVPDDLRSGIYAAHLLTERGEEYIPFFVRPPSGFSSAEIAFLAPTFTYLAYANTNGGCSVCPNMPSLGIYRTHTDSTGVIYSTRLRPIMDMRPGVFANYGPEDKTPRHFTADLNMIDWLEEKGFSYDVITDHDLDSEGASLLDHYNVVITGSHPEYYSDSMLRGMKTYLNSGGRLMYLGGNGFYWVTSQPDDKPHVIEVRKWNGTQGYAAAPGEYYHSTTGELGGLWRFRGHPPQELVGVGFSAQGYGGSHTWRRNAPYKRLPASSTDEADFIFEDLPRQDMIGAFDSPRMGYGIAGDEVDRADPALGTPPHALVVARANDLSTAYQVVLEELNHTGPDLHGPDHPLARADMVYFKYPNQGAVFSVGSLSWFKGLSFNNYENSVSRITENVLRTFMKDGALPK